MRLKTRFPSGLKTRKSKSASRFLQVKKKKTASESKQKLSEHKKAESHYRHAGDKTVNGKMIPAVLPGGRKQFVKRNKNHYSRHGRESYSAYGRV